MELQRRRASQCGNGSWAFDGEAGEDADGEPGHDGPRCMVTSAQVGPSGHGGELPKSMVPGAFLLLLKERREDESSRATNRHSVDKELRGRGPRRVPPRA